MSDELKRLVSPRRRRGTQDPDSASAPSVQNSQAARPAGNPDAVYVAALTTLHNESAAGQLDKDLAAAAARRLGHVYAEKHLGSRHNPARGHNGEAERAASAARQIREELVGSGQNPAKDRLLSELDAAVAGLHQQLLEVRRLSDIASRQNSGRPSPDQDLPGGWEQSVLNLTTRIQAITGRISKLAQMHAKASDDYRIARE
jgi:hypothetical protein